MDSPRGGDAAAAPPAPDFDLLVVNDPGLIDLGTPESTYFPFCGSPVEMDAETRQVEQLLAASGPPSRHHAGKPRARPRPKPLPPASYGHISERVKEIEEANGRMVRRLVAVATAPPALQTAAKEHDMVSIL